MSERVEKRKEKYRNIFSYSRFLLFLPHTLSIYLSINILYLPIIISTYLVSTNLPIYLSIIHLSCFVRFFLYLLINLLNLLHFRSLIIYYLRPCFVYITIVAIRSNCQNTESISIYHTKSCRTFFFFFNLHRYV